MFFSLFHVLYMLGKHIYANCFALKVKIQTDETIKAATDREKMGTSDLQPKTTYKIPLHKFSPPAYIQRYEAVIKVLEDPKYCSKLRKIVEFGCAEIRLLPYLKNLMGVEEILFVDTDKSLLLKHVKNASPLILDYTNKRQRPFKIEICAGNAIDSDKKLENADAVICIELIEHLHSDTLACLPENIFGFIKPKVVIMTTPNVEFNVLFALEEGEFRHSDHKFEWSRSQFKNWCQDILLKYTCYNVTFEDICFGPEGTESLGACSQMAVFERKCEFCPISSKRHLKGIEGIYETIETFNYPYYEDHRVIDEKMLDEILYYTYYLMMYEEYDSLYSENQCEVDLKKLQSMMRKYPISLEEIKEILKNKGYTVENRKSGPVFILPSDQQSTSTSTNCNSRESLHSDKDINNVDTIMNENEIFRSTDWEEESSIIIPQNSSMKQENSYLFDGVEETTNNYHLLEQTPTISKDTEFSEINDFGSSPIYTEQCSEDRSKNSLTSSAIETNNTYENSRSSQLHNLLLTCKDSLDASNVTNILNNVTVDITQPGPSHSDVLDIKNIPTNSDQLPNFQSEMSVSHSITSPLFSQNVEPSNSSTSQHFNESSHIVEIAENIKCNNRSEMSLSEYTSLNNSKIYCSDTPKQNDISQMENQITQVGRQTLGINPNNQSRLTSSPRSCKNISNTSINENCMASSASVFMLDSYNELSPIKGTKRMYINWTLEDVDSEEYSTSNDAVTKTIDLCTMPSNKNGKDGISRHDVNYSTSNNTEQKLHSANKTNDERCSASSNQCEEYGNRMKKNVEKDLINCEVDEYVVDVEKLDEHLISLSDAYENHTGHMPEIAESMGTDETSAETWSESANECLPHLNINEKATNMSTDLLTSKSLSECSTLECANETDTSKDNFVSFEDSAKQAAFQSPASVSTINDIVRCDITDIMDKDLNMSNVGASIANAKTKSPSPGFETPLDSLSHEIVDSGYPNSASGQDITPENDLSSIAQDHIPDIESPSIAEVPKLDVPEPMEVENGDLANNNRDDEGNNMMAVDANNDIEGLQPFFDVLENDIENENDIYVLENGFPMWLLRILNMPNPFDMQLPQNVRDPDQADQADNVNYADPDEGFDSDE